MREICILNCPEIECPLVLEYVYVELCNAFVERGYTVTKIDRIEKIHNHCIVFMGNTFHPEKKPSTLTFAQMLHNQAPDAIYIGWYWYTQDVSPLRYFIHTYENHTNPKYLESRSNEFSIMTKGTNHCPLYLRANEHPEKIGKYERRPKIDYCYMGAIYRQQLVPTQFRGIYHATNDHTKYLSYSQRKGIYLSSTFALGFQSNENIYSHHVSQRIYEGLAYGCIVFSESIHACLQTNNIVVHIVSKEDLESKMDYYLKHPELMRQKQEEGYAFIKQYGTNHFSIDVFLERIKELGLIE